MIYGFDIAFLKVFCLPYQQVWMLWDENDGDIENVSMVSLGLLNWSKWFKAHITKRRGILCCGFLSKASLKVLNTILNMGKIVYVDKRWESNGRERERERERDIGGEKGGREMKRKI